MVYSVGDVVRSYYYWMENGTKKGIIRPVIIIEIKDNNYIVAKISRSDKRGDLYRVKVNSREWREMGLYDRSKDSFVDRTAIQLITEREIERKIGDCPVNIMEFIYGD